MTTTTSVPAKDLQEFAGNAPAEIRLGGKILCILPNPPKLGDEITLNIKLRVIDSVVSEHEDGEHVFYRKVKLIGAWRDGEPPPIDTNQPQLWDQAPEVGTFDREASADEGDEIIAAHEEAKAARKASFDAD